MPHSPKIATCCYCGTKAALVLGGKTTRHELTCSACGAPLHALKRLKTDASPPLRDRGAAAPLSKVQPAKPQKPRKQKPKKKRKSTARWLFEEIADIVDDVFD